MNDIKRIEVSETATPEPARASSRVARLTDHATSLAMKVASLISFIAIWAIAAAILNDTQFLPAPWTVGDKLIDLVRNEDFFFHAWGTVRRVFVGFAFALLVGLAAGVIMGLWRRAEQFLDIYILIGLTIPGLAWALLSVMWFGVSELAPIFSIVMVTAPMLAVNAWQGTKAIDKSLIDMAKAFRIRRHRLLTGIIIPQLAPYLFAASRFGFGLGWKVVVLSEIFGLTNGIGYMINRGFSRFSMTDVLAWTLGFTVIMFVFEYGVLQPIERRVLRWRPKLNF
jgi:NitT/TauT family transport system permease protein